MHTIEVILAVAGGLALVMGLFTYWIRGHWINEPLLALLVGVLVGPEVLGWIDLSVHGDPIVIIELVALLTLAITLASVGVELRASLNWIVQPMLLLGTLGTAAMWLSSTVIVGLVLDVTVLEAILLGAILAPIDPILTATVATGRIAREHVPERIRHLLSAEASVRHGFGLILVLLPAYLVRLPDADAWQEWVTTGVLWKGIASLAVGIVIGLALGRLDRWSSARGVSEDTSGDLHSVLLALAVGLLATVTLAEGDGIVAVLGAAVAFAVVRIRREEWPDEQIEGQQRSYTELIKQVLQVFVFLLLGTILPWSDWQDLGWRGPALVVLILLGRRLPIILLMAPRIRGIRALHDALFVGWFGPIGIGALSFAAVAYHETELTIIWTVTTLVVTSSIVVHDLSATPLSQWLGRRTPPEEERQPGSE